MSPGRCIVQVISGVPARDGAGVRLKRILGSPECDYLDPFLLFDEFRNDNPDDYIAGFPSHPHRGFETVTYMLRGQMRHEDSAGNTGLLTAGSVQWMTAGQGIIHSEMPEQLDGMLWGYQLWVNLPSRLKMSRPRYQDIPATDIPEVKSDAALVRVIAGDYADTAGSAETLIPVTYLDVHLIAGSKFVHAVDDSHNTFSYVHHGALSAADSNGREINVETGYMAIFGQTGDIHVTAGPAGAKFLLVSGSRISEPVARMGPFVMNTREELLQAAEDYRRGTLA